MQTSCTKMSGLLSYLGARVFKRDWSDRAKFSNVKTPQSSAPLQHTEADRNQKIDLSFLPLALCLWQHIELS